MATPKTLLVLRVIGTFILWGVLVYVALDISYQNSFLESWYWALFLIPVILSILAIVFDVKFKLEFFKWISPTVSLFLISGISFFWVLKINLLEERLKNLEETGKCEINTTELITPIFGGKDVLGNIITKTPDKAALQFEMYLLIILGGGYSITTSTITTDTVAVFNWLNLALLVNIGTAADIFEFSNEVLSVGEVQCDTPFIVIYLLAWSVSLLHFALVPRERSLNKENVTMCLWIHKFQDFKIVFRLLSLDVPFFAIRTYLVMYGTHTDPVTTFFYYKNILMMLGLLRVGVLFFKDKMKVEQEDEEVPVEEGLQQHSNSTHEFESLV